MPPVVTSPYIDGRPISQMVRWQCAYCCRPLTDLPGDGPRRRTQDHVLPRAFGRIHDSTISNLRPCCARCNQLRARLGHCAGALVLAIIEGRHRHQDVGAMAITLGMLPSAEQRLVARRNRRLNRQRYRVDAIAD